LGCWVLPAIQLIVLLLTITLDAIYQQNINISGTFGNRNLSIYAKGLLFDKLSYRAAITNPYRNAAL
jgi:hypothetical protein